MRRNAPYLRHCSFFLGIFWPSLFADCTLGCLYFSVISCKKKYSYCSVGFLQVCWPAAHHMNNLILWIKIRGDCYLLFRQILWLIFDVMGDFNQSIGNNFCYISYSITKPFSLRISLDSGSILECQLYLAIFCMISFKWTAELEYKKMADNSKSIDVVLFCYLYLFVVLYLGNNNLS